MVLTHLHDARVVPAVRAQLDLHLERVRSDLGFAAVFVARVIGGTLRVEALSADNGTRVGALLRDGTCPVVSAADLGGALAEGVYGVPLRLASGALYGVLGGTGAPEGRPDPTGALRDHARQMAVGLDLLRDHEVAAQRVRSAVSEAIREARFYPVFQPVRDLVSGGVIYREGLTRIDPALGVSVPEMLCAARSVGMGPALELAFARAILSCARDWPEPGGLAINLSETTLHSPEFSVFLEREAGPGITVELTEHEPVRDYPALARVVARMRAAGLSLAIDDAGAGYTSLRHILDLKPDVLNLDAHLSSRVDSDPGALALLALLQGYCDETGTLLVIEGVEREDQLKALRGIGVRYVQGYFTGGPQRWLDRRAV